MIRFHRRQRTVCISLLTGLVLPVLVLLARAETPSPDTLAQNAALDYWKACALLRAPQTPEETRILNFITNEMPNLPPGVLAVRTGAGRWLLQEAAAWAALTDGASKPFCVFSSPSDSPTPNRDHLPELDRLTRRALSAAKAYEDYNNKDGAATIYVSLFGLASHLDSERDLNAGVFAADLIQRDDQDRVVACNLDIKNPHSGEVVDHRAPAEIVDAIIAQEQRIIGIMDEIKALLAERV